MRVISQDGMIDVPYEQITIQIENKSIYFLNDNIADGENNYMPLAVYCSKEKAKKAMEMMREAYSNFEIIKSLIPCFGERILIGYKKEPDNEIFNKFSRFDTFRFPSDDEISI